MNIWMAWFFANNIDKVLISIDNKRLFGKYLWLQSYSKPKALSKHGLLCQEGNIDISEMCTLDIDISRRLNISLFKISECHTLHFETPGPSSLSLIQIIWSINGQHNKGIEKYVDNIKISYLMSEHQNMYC